MTTEDNGNVGLLKPTSSSNEDLSEYTDADESISAPTEFLAEVCTTLFCLHWSDQYQKKTILPVKVLYR